MRFQLLTFFVLSLATEGLSDIANSSPTLWNVTRGDKLQLELQGTGLEDTLWFMDRIQVHKGASMDVDTGLLGPGERQLEAINLHDGEFNIVLFKINITPSPPLYKPIPYQKGAADVSNITRLPKTGHWIVSTKGRILETSRSVKTAKDIILPRQFPLKQGQPLYVPTGSEALIIGNNGQEKLFVFGPSELTYSGDHLEILTGQYLWRRAILDSVSTESRWTLSLGDKIHLESSKAGDAFFQINQQGQTRLISLKDFEDDISAVCSNSKRLAFHRSESWQLQTDGSEQDCSADRLKVNPSPNFWSLWTQKSQHLAHWFGESESAYETLFNNRVQMPQVDQGLDRSIQLADKMMDGKHWITAMEYVSTRPEDLQKEPSMMIKQGQVALELGYLKFAFDLGKGALQNAPEDADAAFLIAKTLSAMKRPSQARDWFEKSIAWNYSDHAEASRCSSAESLLNHEGRKAERARHEAFIYADDEDWKEDLKATQQIRDSRIKRGRMSVTGLRVKSIYPFDSDKVANFPFELDSNSGYVTDLDAQWSYSLTKEGPLKLNIEGEHALSQPLSSGFTGASVNDHFFGLNAKMSGEMVEPIVAIRGGTRIRGGQRQTEEFHNVLGVTYGDPLKFGFLWTNVRAFDPVPGGTDFIDARLNMFIEEADHSHFDSIFSLTAAYTDELWRYGGGIHSGKIDFRDGPLDNYDATELDINAYVGKRIYRRVVVDLKLGQISRQYQSEGADSILKIKAGCEVIIVPLWTAGLSIVQESRTSGVDALNYKGDSYGLWLSVDL